MHELHATTIEENTFSSSTHRTFLKIDHVLGHKASLNKCQGLVSYSLTISIKLKINNDKNRHLKIFKVHFKIVDELH